MIANMHEAKTKLSKLVESALEGEEVVIAKAGKSLVKLVPVMDAPTPRKPGALKGKVYYMSDYFNAEDSEIESRFDSER